MNKSNLRMAAVLGLATILLASMGAATSAALGKGKPSATTSDTTTTTTASDTSVTTETAPSKALVCHLTHSKKKPSHTINVSVNAVPAHLAHGDTLGACGVAAPSPTVTQGTTLGNGHGKGNGHSK